MDIFDRSNLPAGLIATPEQQAANAARQASIAARRQAQQEAVLAVLQQKSPLTTDDIKTGLFNTTQVAYSDSQLNSVLLSLGMAKQVKRLSDGTYELIPQESK